jgi:hypothetical protein
MTLIKVAALAVLFTLMCAGSAAQKVNVGLAKKADMLHAEDADKDVSLAETVGLSSSLSIGVSPQLKQALRALWTRVDDDAKHFRRALEAERHDKAGLRGELRRARQEADRQAQAILAMQRAADASANRTRNDEAKFEEKTQANPKKRDSVEAQLAEHEKRLDLLTAKDSAQQRQIDRCANVSPWRSWGNSTGSRRGMQSQGPASEGEVIRMWKREAMSFAPTGAGDGGGGHRRELQAKTCDLSTIKQRSEDINAECCDEPGEDCRGGVPHSCNAGCSALLVPFWKSCGAALGADAKSIRKAVATCPDPASQTGPRPLRSSYAFALSAPPPSPYRAAWARRQQADPACTFTILALTRLSPCWLTRRFDGRRRAWARHGGAPVHGDVPTWRDHGRLHPELRGGDARRRAAAGNRRHRRAPAVRAQRLHLSGPSRGAYFSKCKTLANFRVSRSVGFCMGNPEQDSARAVSWIGASALGGYLGANVMAFFAAVM